MRIPIGVIAAAAAAMTASAAIDGQTREPAKAKSDVVVRSRQQVADIETMLAAKPGNTNENIVAPSGMQTRVAVFHDSRRVDDLNEVHDLSDDIYYVLKGEATLVLGGSLIDPQEISPGEWRAKTATGGREIKIKKGDLVFVPRGTPHQRTVAGKGFSMILIKIFAVEQPGK